MSLSSPEIGYSQSTHLSNPKENISNHLNNSEFIHDFVVKSTDEKNNILVKFSEKEKSSFKKALLIEAINIKYRHGETSKIYANYASALQNPLLQNVKISLDLKELLTGTKKWVTQIGQGLYKTAEVAGMIGLQSLLYVARPLMNEEDKRICDESIKLYNQENTKPFISGIIDMGRTGGGLLTLGFKVLTKQPTGETKEQIMQIPIAKEYAKLFEQALQAKDGEAQIKLILDVLTLLVPASTTSKLQIFCLWKLYLQNQMVKTLLLVVILYQALIVVQD